MVVEKLLYNHSAVVEKFILQTQVHSFTVQKMFCYHLRQKAQWCSGEHSVQKFFEKLLKLSVALADLACLAMWAGAL
jgi:hypothetical protein